MVTIKIGFIGAGKVGFSLGKYLKENNIIVAGYYSENRHSSQEAALFTQSQCYYNLQNLVNNSDIIFITTPDSEIQNIWNCINKFHIDGKLFCHCSGSISSEIFSNIEKYGAYGYSIHPMFAVSSKYNSYKNFPEAFITIEGHEKYREKLKDLFVSFGNDVVIISKENKVLYHAACVVVSNLVLGLIGTGAKYLEECNFPEEIAIKALLPLIEFNLKNIKSAGIIQSLTGPVERGDLSTIKNHCNALGKEDEILYKLLSKKVLDIATSKNINRDYSEIEKYLGGYDEEHGCNI